MKGKILDYNFQESKGVISGDDGNRYSFVKAECKTNSSVVVGKNVDFIPNEDTATQIYFIESDFSSTFSNLSSNDVERGAILGAIGSGFTLLSFLPIGILFWIIGLILEIFGVKKLSDNAQNEKGIFLNFIIGEFAILVGCAIFIMVAGISIFGGIIGSETEYANEAVGAGIFGFIFGFLIFIIFGIFGLIKMYKALSQISNEYKVGLMKFVAVGYVIGVILVPFFGLGLIILLIMNILKIFAYLKIQR